MIESHKSAQSLPSLAECIDACYECGQCCP